jgi:hypothetical protein
MRWTAVLVVTILAVSACSRHGPRSTSAETPPEGPTDPVASAREIFASRCASCHGPQGHGDGPAGAGLNPRPTDFTRGALALGNDEEALRRIIVGGGHSVGRSPLMPPNPDLQDKPQVVNELVRMVRTLARGGTPAPGSV